jgi:outer membrane protein OmpA-like peptidoglycan-associated protein
VIYKWNGHAGETGCGWDYYRVVKNKKIFKPCKALWCMDTRRNFVTLGAGAAFYLALTGCNSERPVDPGRIITSTIDEPFAGDVDTLPPLNKITETNPVCAPLDVAFLIDCTSSMSEYIERAKTEGKRILTTVNSTYPGTRFSVGTVADSPEMGGAGDVPYVNLVPFTSDIGDAVAGINRISLMHGGDEAEAYPYALRRLSNEAWRPDAYRIVVLLADSTARDENVLADSVKNANFKLVALIANEANIPYWKRNAVDALPLVGADNLEGMLLRSVMIGCNDYPDVRFDTAKWNLDAQDRSELDKLARSIKTRVGYNIGIRVEGHADARGAAVANRLLGLRRAREVAHYLSSQGIPSGAVEYGEEKPLCNERTNDCLMMNRRAHLYPFVMPQGVRFPHNLNSNRIRGNDRVHMDMFSFAGMQGNHAVYSFVPTSSAYWRRNRAGVQLPECEE